jgi:SAM-dependent methyltransferase
MSAHCLTLEQYISENPSAKFDLICAYHCVEHVSSPKSLIELMQRIILPDGLIVVSVPYSPTNREIFEWECLNLPPHHMTRWNKKSLERLAFEVGMSAEIETDESDVPSLFSVKPLVWKFLSLSGGAGDRRSDYLRPIVHPINFMRLASFILARERVCGKPAGDTALARFRFPRAA